MKTLSPFIRPLDTATVRSTPRDFTPRMAFDFYHSTAWKRLRDRIIRKRGRKCENPACATPHGPWPIIIGDHIKEIRDGGAPLDENNIRLVCQACHNRKTEDERAGRI